MPACWNPFAVDSSHSVAQKHILSLLSCFDICIYIYIYIYCSGSYCDIGFSRNCTFYVFSRQCKSPHVHKRFRLDANARDLAAAAQDLAAHFPATKYHLRCRSMSSSMHVALAAQYPPMKCHLHCPLKRRQPYCHHTTHHLFVLPCFRAKPLWPHQAVA